jgi:hypothetical protein
MSDITCVNPTEQSGLNKLSKDKFVLVLALPKALKKLAVTDEALGKLDPLQISVFGSVVPDVSVPSIAVPYGGQVPNYSSHTRPNYSPLTVNFAVDNSYTNYYILWKWLSVLNGSITSLYEGPDERYITKDDIIETGQLNDYQSNFSILALNEYNEAVTEFKYFNAFITSLKGITYSYKDSEMMETSAEFQYSQFTMERLKRPFAV